MFSSLPSLTFFFFYTFFIFIFIIFYFLPIVPNADWASFLFSLPLSHLTLILSLSLSSPLCSNFFLLQGASSPWNIGAAYRVPDSNINLSCTYQQGRASIQVLQCFTPNIFAAYLPFVHFPSASSHLYQSKMSQFNTLFLSPKIHFYFPFPFPFVYFPSS